MRRHLELALDQPASEHFHEGVVDFSGWCFHRDEPISQLQLRLNSATHAVTLGLYRPDVGRVFPGVQAASRSGFAARVSLSPGDYTVSLEATTTSGKRVRTGRLTRITVWRRDARIRESFGRFVLRKARTRLREGRGIPSPLELFGLLRQTRVDHTTGSLSTAFAPPVPWEPYRAWLDVNRWTPKAERHLRSRLARANAPLPVISVVTPVFRPDRAAFQDTFHSLLHQVHTAWEWCLADDGSDQPELTALLAAFQGADPRLRVVVRSDNGHISRASNSAAALATGEFLAFLDQDDLLTPDAIGEIALYLGAHPHVDVLYTDEDKIDVVGRRFDPQFKPGWSPEALLGRMYVGHFLVVRRALFERVGGFRAGYEGSQDHDLALRVTEHASQVAHLPLVVYHWRATPGSIAESADNKPYAFEAGARAVRDALARRGLDCDVDRPDWAVRANVGVFSPRFPDSGPPVTVLIASRNNVGALRRCMASLGATTYRNYEVVILDDHSDDSETKDFLSRSGHRVLQRPAARERFNYAALHNWAIKTLSSEYVVLLNDDTELRRPEWLSRMMGYARLDGVGAVGARLLFPDDTVQHAGILSGLHHQLVGVAYRGLPASEAGYLGGALAAGNYDAVTAACMLVRRTTFLEHGGFDEHSFAVSFNDVDFCYRLVDAGLRCVYVPEAEFVHLEGASRGLGSAPVEIARLRARYESRHDSHLNPNLSTESERFEIQATRVSRGGEGRLRVLMFTHALDLTGAPICQYEIAVALRDRAIEPFVISPEDGPLARWYEAQGIGVRVVSGDELLDPDLLDRLIADARASVVFASTLRTVYAVRAARRAAVPSIWSIRESEPWDSCYNALPAPERNAALASFAYPYRIVFDSDTCRALFEPLNTRHNFSVLHTGLPPPRVSALRPVAGQDRAAAPVVFVCVGTVCGRKGQHDLPRALALLDEATVARLRCVIVGDRPGPYSDELHRLVSALPERTASRVHVIPEIENVAPQLNDAHVFVCTSRVESFPRVTLEAMAAGLAVIATPVFGVREQLREGTNALFYSPGDASGLADAIRTLVHDGARRAALASASTDVLASLTSFEQMIHGYERVFREASEAAVTET